MWCRTNQVFGKPNEDILKCSVRILQSSAMDVLQWVFSWTWELELSWDILSSKWSKMVQMGSKLWCFHTIRRAVEPGWTLSRCEEMNKSRCSLRISPFRGLLQPPFEGSPQGTSDEHRMNRDSRSPMKPSNWSDTVKRLISIKRSWIPTMWHPINPHNCMDKNIGPGTGRNLNVHPWIRCKRRCGFLHFEILSQDEGWHSN